MSLPIEETALFKLLGPERVERIRPVVRRRPFKDQEYLYHESQPARALWAVRSGEVRTLKVSARNTVILRIMARYLHVK